MDKIIVLDFAGTLIRRDIIEEANLFRSKFLERSIPTIHEHANPKELYKANREFAQKLTGLEPDMNVLYRENDLDFLDISGEKFLNQISTNLFQIGMFAAANKHKKDIFQKGIIDALNELKSRGFRVAIVSGVRTDIISGMIAISKVNIMFDYIYGQPPTLGVENIDNLKMLQKYGKIEYIIGDKLSDLEPAKNLGAKTIFVRWGHPQGEEEGTADYSIDNAEEIEKIIK